MGSKVLKPGQLGTAQMLQQLTQTQAMIMNALGEMNHKLNVLLSEHVDIAKAVGIDVDAAREEVKESDCNCEEKCDKCECGGDNETTAK